MPGTNPLWHGGVCQHAAEAGHPRWCTWSLLRRRVRRAHHLPSRRHAEVHVRPDGATGRRLCFVPRRFHGFVSRARPLRLRSSSSPGGKDEISEVKLWTPLRGGLPVGVGRADTGGNPGSVGDKFAFGNTEERARLANMGCKQRGFRGQRAFDHTTGQGYVKSQRGHYHDGIFGKRNKFNLLLHETFGGGFSPPAVAKINRLARKAQRSGVDRTAYPPHSRLSFVSHHAERISIASVKGVNRAILDRRAKLASELSRRA